MIDTKRALLRKISEYDFAIHEIVLFLDTHPESEKALNKLKAFREARAAAVKAYTDRFGVYAPMVCDVPDDTKTWTWIDGPWPWENESEEN